MAPLLVVSDAGPRSPRAISDPLLLLSVTPDASGTVISKEHPSEGCLTSPGQRARIVSTPSAPRSVTTCTASARSWDVARIVATTVTSPVPPFTTEIEPFSADASMGVAPGAGTAAVAVALKVATPRQPQPARAQVVKAMAVSRAAGWFIPGAP
jgi:hypothetical protein